MAALELEKYMKNFANKVTQVVVQSRLGEKVKTDCNALAMGTDWFNIVVNDHPEVLTETKQALALTPGESILQRLPLCIEISLKTVDGDQMVLEVWSLDLLREKEDQNEIILKENAKGVGVSGSSTGIGNSAPPDQQTVKPNHIVYNRMSIMLKSIISLTRAIPGYKISRQQSKDCYSIYYRIYVDRPQVHTLGDGLKHVRIGQLHTAMGTLIMSVSYRTKMTITPTATNTCTGDGIMLKSDHFRPSDSTFPQQRLCAAMRKGNAGSNDEQKVIDIEKPLRPGAFTDVGKLRKYTEKDYVLRETPPFEWLLRRTRQESGESNGACGSLESLSTSPKISPPMNGHNNSNNNTNVGVKYINNRNELVNNNNNIAFKSFEKEVSAQDSSNSTLSQSPIKSLLIPTPLPTRHSSAPSLPPDEENLLKELNFPFASPTSHVNDLAKFYRDCYHAPPLSGLSEIQTESTGCASVAYTRSGSTETSTVDDLSRQLEQFETSLEDYDKLVSQLGLTTSSSTGSRSSGGLQMSN